MHPILKLALYIFQAFLQYRQLQLNKWHNFKGQGNPIHHYLKSAKFRIELRNSILDTLNAGLETIVKQLGFNIKILVTASQF